MALRQLVPRLLRAGAVAPSATSSLCAPLSLGASQLLEQGTSASSGFYSGLNNLLRGAGAYHVGDAATDRPRGPSTM